MRRLPHLVVTLVLLVTGLFVSDSSAVAQRDPTPTTAFPGNPHVPVGPGRGPTRCVDVLVLGFRGSGEHPRGRTRTGTPAPDAPLPWTSDDFVNPDPVAQRARYGVSTADDRLGPTIGALYEALRGDLAAQGRTVGFWSVGVDDSPGFGYGTLYRAPPVDVVNLSRYLTSMAVDSLTVGIGRQLESLLVGGSRRAPYCPDTRLVVAGFSQGAVIARALVLNLQERWGRRGWGPTPVVDLVLIGDPLFRRGEHRTHGVVHPSDHQVDGLLRLDLVRLCDRSRTTRVVCAVTAMGTSTVRTWFRQVWQSLQRFARMHPRLMEATMGDLERSGTRVHVLCDSGDVVCSPLRVISTMRWDSDFPELLTLRPQRTIHGNYHRTVPWGEVVAGLAAVTGPVAV